MSKKISSLSLNTTLFLIAALIHSVFAVGQSLSSLIRVDDTFYYFQVARNFAHLGWWTFDGIHPTNGLQPLWEIILSAVAWVVIHLGVTDGILLAKIFIFCASIFNLLGIYYLYRLAQAWLTEDELFILLLIWLFSPRLVAIEFIGMENALLLFFISFTLYHSIKIRLDSPAYLVFMSCLLGLLFLTRVDYAPLVAVFGLMLLYRLRKTPRRWVWLTLPICFLVIPYLLYNYLTYHMLLPISGAVKLWEQSRLISSYGNNYGALILYAISQLGKTIILMCQRIIDVITFTGVWGIIKQLLWLSLTQLSTPFEMIVSQSIPIVFYIILGLYYRPNLKPLLERIRVLWNAKTLILWTVFYMLVHTVLTTRFLVYSGQLWYFVSFYMVVSLFASIVLAYFLKSLLLQHKKKIVFVLALNLIIFVAIEHLSYQEVPRQETVTWISENIETDAILAADNAGILGYFSPIPVVNLDGLVNDARFFDYLVNGRVGEYVRQEGIDYYVDMTPYRYDKDFEIVYQRAYPLPLHLDDRQFTYYFISKLNVSP